MKTLLTGFEPFGEREKNISWELAKNFIRKNEIKVIQLPVSFSRASDLLIKEINSKEYDLILMLGETSTTDTIRLERIGINIKDSTGPDNDGITANEEPIIKDAPAAYFTSFPVKQLTTELKESGFPVKISNSAGTFVCNYIYYSVLHHLMSSNSSIKALFVHVPATTETLSLKKMYLTINEIIRKSWEF